MREKKDIACGCKTRLTKLGSGHNSGRDRYRMLYNFITDRVNLHSFHQFALQGRTNEMSRHIEQRCKTLGCHVSWATKVCTVEPSTCGSSVWSLLYRGADKSLARPGSKQARKHDRDASYHKVPQPPARLGSERNSRHSDRNISLFPSWSSQRLISAPVCVL